MYDILLLDLDDTILDFHKAEGIALSRTLEELGIPATDQVCARYSAHNKACWERLERGELTREKLMTERFRSLFEELGMDIDASLAAKRYPENLSQGHYFLPGALEALEALAKKYRLFLVSNGNAAVQAGRLKSANIGRFFEGIFISELVGADKPSPVFFERVFAQIPDLDKGKTLIVGDSLTSDILGGNNAQIATCWINPKGSPQRSGITADYELKSLMELEALLESL